MDTKLTECRRLLGVVGEPVDLEPTAEPTVAESDAAEGECLRCPNCSAPLRRRELPPAYLTLAPTPPPLQLVAALDTS